MPDYPILINKYVEYLNEELPKNFSATRDDFIHDDVPMSRIVISKFDTPVAMITFGFGWPILNFEKAVGENDKPVINVAFDRMGRH